jgi:HEXXH motif-containing protein
VPLRAGALLLPGLGVADLGPGDPWGVAQLRIADNVVIALSGKRTIVLPVGSGQNASSTSVRWQAIPRLRAEANGIILDVALDALDPFLSGLGEPAPTPSADELTKWQQRLSEAWQILVQYDRETAKAFATVVSTLVPLADTSITDPRSATYGWTFGAIGLSSPRSSVSVAETLVHELHHLILGALEDIHRLVSDDSDEPVGYAPWRDDPRPLSGVLHGCYAYLGLTAFWRRQRKIGGQHDRMRSEVEFARWRLATLDAARRVAGSPTLTPTGRRVVTGISRQLRRWRADPVTPEAERLAREARTEHWTRWRINRMSPQDRAVAELARAWLSGAQVVRHGAYMDSVAQTRSPAIGPILGYFMEMRYRDPLRFDLLMQGGATHDVLGEFARRLTEADIALLHHDDTAAVREYSLRLRTDSELGAWIGLAIALPHSSPSASTWALTERPELVAALYSRIRAIHGESPEPTELIEWLGEYLMPLRTQSGPILRSP